MSNERPTAFVAAGNWFRLTDAGSRPNRQRTADLLWDHQVTFAISQAKPGLKPNIRNIIGRCYLGHLAPLCHW